MFGLRGELKLDASRIGDDAVCAGLVALLRLPDGTTREVTIAAVRRQKDRPLIRIAGIDDADAAQALVGAQLTIAREDAPLNAGEYFDEDLVGCRLLDEDGIERGVVARAMAGLDERRPRGEDDRATRLSHGPRRRGRLLEDLGHDRE